MIQIRGILLKQLISHSRNNIPVVHNLLNVLYFRLILETFSLKKDFFFQLHETMAVSFTYKDQKLYFS